MLFYHGSSLGDLRVLQPFTADHGKPYVYLTTDEVSAGFYAASVVERPYYWFPYGYDPNGKPFYSELYPGAFAEAYQHKPGYLYACELDEKKLLRFASNRNTRMSTEPVVVTRCERIENLHDWFLQREKEGRLTIQRFADFSQEALSLWHEVILEELRDACRENEPDNPYARFVQKKLPVVWNRYLRESD